MVTFEEDVLPSWVALAVTSSDVADGPVGVGLKGEDPAPEPPPPHADKNAEHDSTPMDSHFNVFIFATR
jgi:hypothetical protein